jgi:hypothetical protein
LQQTVHAFLHQCEYFELQQDFNNTNTKEGANQSTRNANSDNARDVDALQLEHLTFVLETFTLRVTPIACSQLLVKKPLFLLPKAFTPLTPPRGAAHHMQLLARSAQHRRSSGVTVATQFTVGCRRCGNTA